MTGDFYQPRRGWLHGLDPRSSLILSFVTVVSLFIISQPQWLLAALLVIHLLLFSARISLKVCLRLWAIILPLMLMIFILWPLFNTQGERVLFHWRFIKITQEALLSGAATTLRLPSLLLASYMPLMTHRQNVLI
nr:energy-coupling factor transporter transmembrane component T [Spirochaetaceae bacterium]